jgi:hypothetical protein
LGQNDERVFTLTRVDEAPRLARVQPRAVSEDVIRLLQVRAEASSVCLETTVPERQIVICIRCP